MVTKIDLAEAAGFDREAFYEALGRVRPDLPVLEVSARAGTGMSAWLSWLEEQARAARAAMAGAPGGRELRGC